MFRFKLRTLLIVLALGPPVLAGMWPILQEWIVQRRIDDLDLDRFRFPFSGAIELYDPSSSNED